MSTLLARAAGTHDDHAQGGKAKKPCSRFRHRGNGDGVQTQKAAGRARERKIGTGTGRLIIVIKIHPTQSVEFRIAGGKVQQGGGTGGDQQGGIAMGIIHPEIDVISGADGGVEGLVQRAGPVARRTTFKLHAGCHFITRWNTVGEASGEMSHNSEGCGWLATLPGGGTLGGGLRWLGLHRP